MEILSVFVFFLPYFYAIDSRVTWIHAGNFLKD